MRCPKCQFDHALQTNECLKCGIVFARYQAALDAAAKQVAPRLPTNDVSLAAPKFVPQFESMTHPRALLPCEAVPGRNDALRELKYRLLALPVALLVARWVVSTGLRIPVSMLAMVLHESGHAITSWLTGRWAVPMPWVTMHGESRSWLIVLMLSAAIVLAGFLAWQAEWWGWRWQWIGISGTVLLLQLIVLSLPIQEALIVFGGDGGALILATILMTAFYAPRESPLRTSWGLRWGLLAIGALTFMHVFRTWAGPVEDMPFGEIEGVNMSDPSLLTEMYGWSVKQLVDRYLHLATTCLIFLCALYVWGLAAAYLETRIPASQEKTQQRRQVPRSEPS
jgi:hypothetical protein